MSLIQKLQQSPAAKIALVCLFLGSAAIVVFEMRSLFGASSAGADSSLRWFVCSETRKPFQKTIEIGMTMPVLSPFSGKNTGYPAELCYWTKDGSIKTDPTPVLLNTYIGDNSPTFCPDCGRLVVGHNPAPVPGHAPPPTRQEWESKHSQ